MSNIIKKDQANIVDNFEGWDDGVEGDDRPQGAGIIQGILVKFTNEAEWTTRDGEELPTDLELVAVDVARIVQKWEDQRPVETIMLEPHQKFPDIVEMNNKLHARNGSRVLTARCADRGKANMFFTCWIRKPWINIRSRPALRAAELPSAIYATRPCGCDGCEAPMSTR